jgi:Photosystem II complex subunit Ycf12
MDLLALSLSLGFLSDINWVLIAQLTMLALVLLAGPVVIFALAAFKGDL